MRQVDDGEAKGAGSGRIHHGSCHVSAVNYAQRFSLCVVFGERPVGHAPKTPNYAHGVAMCAIGERARVAYGSVWQKVWDGGLVAVPREWAFGQAAPPL